MYRIALEFFWKQTLSAHPSFYCYQIVFIPINILMGKNELDRTAIIIIIIVYVKILM